MIPRRVKATAADRAGKVSRAERVGEGVRGRITEHGLFADLRGAAGDPPLLFLHGGPGQGCYEFMAMQRDHLVRMVRLIGLDQRGVGRSAPLPHGAPLTQADLVDNCEQVRRALGCAGSVVWRSAGAALRDLSSRPRHCGDLREPDMGRRPVRAGRVAPGGRDARRPRPGTGGAGRRGVGGP